MLIDHTLYNWSQTAPITITLEALEQDVYFAAPVRIYKVSGTAQVSFYADAEKTDLLFSGSLPWMPAELLHRKNACWFDRGCRCEIPHSGPGFQ